MDKYNSIVPRFFGPTKPRFAVTLFGTAYYTVPESEVGLRWRRHEDYHKIQQARDGWKFYFKYLWYQLRYGYTNNPYEVAARKASYRGGQNGSH